MTTLASATLVVPAGKVASTLTNFVTRVNLADLPAAWWAALATAGDGALRVRASDGSELPFDAPNVNSSTSTGELFFRATLTTSANVFTLDVVEGATTPAVTDSNGRNAVWSDYDFFINFVELVDRTGNGHDPSIVGTVTGYNRTLELTSTKFVQGVAWDGTNWYATGNNTAYKINTSGTALVSITDLAASTGLSFTHVSGCCIKGGELYVSVENGDSAGTAQKILVLNTSDLSLNRWYDVSGHGEMSDICWNPNAGKFVLSDFYNGSRLHVFDATFSTYSSLTIPSSPISQAQGIEWAGGKYFIVKGTTSKQPTLYSIADDMSGSVETLWIGANGLVVEGLATKDQSTSTPVLYCGDEGFGNLGKLAYTVGPSDPGWLCSSGTANAVVTGLNRRTAWSYGATVKMLAVPTSNRSIVSYSDNSSSDTNRETLSIQANSKWDLWDSPNGHTTGPTAVSGDIGQRRRVNATFDTTVSRRLYLQGSQVAQKLIVTQKPSGGTGTNSAVFIGAEDTSVAERWNGSINYVYLRNGVLSADWLAAEYASWEGSSFYSITPGVVLQGAVPLPAAAFTVDLPPLDVTFDGTVPLPAAAFSVDPIPTVDVVLSAVVPFPEAAFSVDPFVSPPVAYDPAPAPPRVNGPRPLPSPTYRYLLCDLLTDRPVASVPLTGVSFDRRLSRTGSLTGTLNATTLRLVELGKTLQLMAGRAALWVFRDGEIWWGGIPWTIVPQQGDRDGVSVQVTAATFDSYAHHRELYADLAFTATDQGVIIPELWRTIQADPRGDIGVVADDQPTGVLRDITYTGGSTTKVGQYVEDMGDLADGPEHTIRTYVQTDGSRIKELVVSNRIGSTEPRFVFSRTDRGLGGRLSEWSEPTDAVNSGTAFRSIGDGEASSGRLFADDLLDQGWPLLDVSESRSGVTDTAVLDEYAQTLRSQRAGAVRTRGYKVSVGSTGWSPNRLGEAVRIKMADDWHGTTDETVRPVGVKVTAADRDTTESIELMFGDD